MVFQICFESYWTSSRRDLIETVKRKNIVTSQSFYLIVFRNVFCLNIKPRAPIVLVSFSSEHGKFTNCKLF